MIIQQYLNGVHNLVGGNDYYFTLPPSSLTGQPFTNIPSKPLEEVYIICDATNGNSIQIYLPSTKNLEIHWNLKIYITLIGSTNNASVTIIPFTGSILPAILPDTISGKSNVTISGINTPYYLHITAPYNWMLINATQGASFPEYRLAALPSKSIVSKTETNLQNYGTFYDLNLIGGGAYNLITLNNGDLASADYCIAVLGDGTLIYETFNLNEYTNDPASNYGYWVAYRVDSNDLSKLVKVAELKMTDQFWDNWYNWTYQSPLTPNKVVFVTGMNAYNDSDVFTSYNTQLQIVNNVLIATDLIVGNGDTILNIYNTETGSSIVSGTWAQSYPYYNIQNDGYGMMDGANVGFIYYTETSVNYKAIVGLNILTGQIIWFDAVSSLTATTNFNPVGIVDATYFETGFFNNYFLAHPSGCLFTVYNKQLIDYANNTNGVTAIFSPNWTNNTKVVFLIDRESINGIFSSTNGFIQNNEYFSVSPAFDSNNIYLITNMAGVNFGISGNAIKIYRASLDNVTQTNEWTLTPTTQINEDITFVPYFVNETGVIFYYLPNGNNNFSQFQYLYWKQGVSKPYYLQSNNVYPTNLILNKIYDTATMLTYNNQSLGIQFDIYKITF